MPVGPCQYHNSAGTPQLRLRAPTACLFAPRRTCEYHGAPASAILLRAPLACECHDMAASTTVPASKI
eukprot:493814-Pyramimonas_sp.AAC.1